MACSATEIEPGTFYERWQGKNRSSNPQLSIFSCRFLALARHLLGNHAEARTWFAKAVLPKDAPWEEAMIDRRLRREVEVEVK